MAERYEGGSAPRRIEWVPEDEEGVTPDSPSWNPLSYNVVTPWDAEPDASTEPIRGVGTAFPRGHTNGPETHESTFTYHLSQWFVDGSGNTVDPSYDAMRRAPDNSIAATHTVMSRETHATGGVADNGRHLYTVGRGGHPAVATVPFETEDGLPIEVELEYQFESIRKYSVSQPPSSGATLTVVSTSEDDTQDLNLATGDGTSETVTLTGTTEVTTTSTHSSLDAAELSERATGTVTVADGDGNTLLTIHGANDYEFGEGDLGIPGGTHAPALTEDDLIQFNGDYLDYDGTPIADEFVSGELSVDQGIDSNSKAESRFMNVHGGEAEATVTSTVNGPDVSAQQWNRYLQEITADIVWHADEGTVTVSNAQMSTPGSFAPESGQSKTPAEVEWMGEGVSATASGS